LSICGGLGAIGTLTQLTNSIDKLSVNRSDLSIFIFSYLVGGLLVGFLGFLCLGSLVRLILQETIIGKTKAKIPRKSQHSHT